VRFRGQDVEPGALAGLKHQLAHAHVDLLLAPSRGLAAKLRQLDTQRPVVAVTLGCDAARYAPVAAAAPARPEILLLGRLDPVKGHERALALLRLIINNWQGPGAPPCLHFIGEPANLSVTHLQHRAAALGLAVGSDVVITARRVESLAAALSSATLGLVSSLGSEIIGRVAEEFLLCGTPVLVSGAGSLDEVLAFPAAGASFRDYDDAATAALIASWLRRSGAETAAEKQARAAAARLHFSLEAMGQALGHALMIGGDAR
jgi:glycosyltransferase involved in cell wall biosynthesis